MSDRRETGYYSTEAEEAAGAQSHLETVVMPLTSLVDIRQARHHVEDELRTVSARLELLTSGRRPTQPGRYVTDMTRHRELLQDIVRSECRGP
jgi:hypothetical protein